MNYSAFIIAGQLLRPDLTDVITNRRRIIVNLAVSADGYIARPDGDIDWLTKRPAPKGFNGLGEFERSIDTKLLGRKTYRRIICLKRLSLANISANALSFSALVQQTQLDTLRNHNAYSRFVITTTASREESQLKAESRPS